MKSLKEEIAYQREKGFHHNTIELKTLLMWLGEQVAIEYENKRLRDEINKLRIERLQHNAELRDAKVKNTIPAKIRDADDFTDIRNA